MRLHLSRACRPLAAALLVAVAVSVFAAGPAASAEPSRDTAPKAAFLRVGERTTTNGRLDASLSVSLARASSLTVRYRLYGPGSQLLFQKTDRLTSAAAGTRILSLSRDLAGLGVREGICRLEAVVRAGGRTVKATAPVFVVDEDRASLPLAVVVRLATTPMRDPAGRFVLDPAGTDPARTQADAVARLASQRPDLRLSLVLPPLAIEDWSRASAGYSLAETGSVPVTSDATAAVSAGATVEAVLAAARSGSLSLLSVGYADPSAAGLESAGALSDLGLQLDRGSAVTSGSVVPAPARGLSVRGDRLPRTALPTLASRGIGFALLSPDGGRLAAKGRETTPTPGVYTIAESTMTALVSDPRATALLSQGARTQDEVLAYLFGRLISKAASTTPVVAVIDLGAGSDIGATDLVPMLSALSRTGWVRLVDVEQAARSRPSGTITLPRSLIQTDTPSPPLAAPVASARSRTLALLASAGAADPDASAALDGLLVAESAAWDGSDPARERGLGFAAAAGDRAWSVLSKATLAIPNVTLSGSSGRVPVSVNNGSGRILALTLRVTPKGLRLSRTRTIRFVAMPGENIQSVPVDMGSSLEGGLHFELDAGDANITSGDAVVRASYVDRLAVLVTVVLVLLALLWYIRRKAPGALSRIGQSARTQD